MTASSFVAGNWTADSDAVFRSWDPVENSAIAEYREASVATVGAALQKAERASHAFSAHTPEERAAFLRQIAVEILHLGDELIQTTRQETGLPEARLINERGRTCGQLRAFADLIEDGSWVQACIDSAKHDRLPLPKPDVRSMLVPLGPVAVFAASNFPFAFGCLGGDTASAFAAGNPVVAKAHPGHPATSILLTKAISRAISQCGLPDGSFALLQGQNHELGSALVAHPFTAAVGFTGSLGGGRALMDRAAGRPAPIPVFAEMGSINPVFIMPDALDRRGEAIANDLGASIALGAGQFCTNPGLIVTLRDVFIEPLAKALALQPTGYMLNPDIAARLHQALESRSAMSQLEVVAGGIGSSMSLQPRNTLFKVDAEDFIAMPQLQEEVFGPASLLVECGSVDQMLDVAAHLHGNLTATIHTDNHTSIEVIDLLQCLSNIAGRILLNGYPTGVEVCPAMQHGGPYPASSTAATTSVGTAAITRFCKRIAFQDCPDSLLPPELQDANPCRIWRQVDGEPTRTAITRSE